MLFTIFKNCINAYYWYDAIFWYLGIGAKLMDPQIQLAIKYGLTGLTYVAIWLCMGPFIRRLKSVSKRIEKTLKLVDIGLLTFIIYNVVGVGIVLTNNAYPDGSAELKERYIANHYISNKHNNLSKNEFSCIDNMRKHIIAQGGTTNELNDIINNLKKEYKLFKAYRLTDEAYSCMDKAWGKWAPEDENGDLFVKRNKKKVKNVDPGEEADFHEDEEVEIEVEVEKEEAEYLPSAPRTGIDNEKGRKGKKRDHKPIYDYDDDGEYINRNHKPLYNPNNIPNITIIQSGAENTHPVWDIIIWVTKVIIITSIVVVAVVVAYHIALALGLIKLKDGINKGLPNNKHFCLGSGLPDKNNKANINSTYSRDNMEIETPNFLPKTVYINEDNGYSSEDDNSYNPSSINYSHISVNTEVKGENKVIPTVDRPNTILNRFKKKGWGDDYTKRQLLSHKAWVNNAEFDYDKSKKLYKFGQVEIKPKEFSVDDRIKLAAYRKNANIITGLVDTYARPSEKHSFEVAQLINYYCKAVDLDLTEQELIEKVEIRLMSDRKIELWNKLDTILNRDKFGPDEFNRVQEYIPVKEELIKRTKPALSIGQKGDPTVSVENKDGKEQVAINKNVLVPVLPFNNQSEPVKNLNMDNKQALTTENNEEIESDPNYNDKENDDKPEVTKEDNVEKDEELISNAMDLDEFEDNTDKNNDITDENIDSNEDNRNNDKPEVPKEDNIEKDESPEEADKGNKEDDIKDSEQVSTTEDDKEVEINVNKNDADNNNVDNSMDIDDLLGKLDEIINKNNDITSLTEEYNRLLSKEDKMAKEREDKIRKEYKNELVNHHDRMKALIDKSNELINKHNELSKKNVSYFIQKYLLERDTIHNRSDNWLAEVDRLRNKTKEIKKEELEIDKKLWDNLNKSKDTLEKNKEKLKKELNKKIEEIESASKAKKGNGSGINDDYCSDDDYEDRHEHEDNEVVTSKNKVVKQEVSLKSQGDETGQVSYNCTVFVPYDETSHDEYIEAEAKRLAEELESYDNETATGMLINMLSSGLRRVDGACRKGQKVAATASLYAGYAAIAISVTCRVAELFGYKLPGGLLKRGLGYIQNFRNLMNGYGIISESSDQTPQTAEKPLCEDETRKESQIETRSQGKKNTTKEVEVRVSSSRQMKYKPKNNYDQIKALGTNTSAIMGAGSALACFVAPPVGLAMLAGSIASAGVVYCSEEERRRHG